MIVIFRNLGGIIFARLVDNDDALAKDIDRGDPLAQ